MTGQSYGGSDTVTYLYDNDGALSTVIDSASGSKTKYFYDFAGLLTKFTENRGSHARRVEYTYTEENQVSQKSEFAGNVRQNTYYRYDDFHRRTQVGTNSTWWKYTYDALSRVATQRFTVSGADILTETVTYNNANQVTSIQKVTPENTRTHSYTYDDNGNIATVTVGNQTTQYFYDTAGQLVRENNETAGTTTLWTYDNAGNILREKVYAYTYGTETPSQLLEDNDYFYASTDWGDLLIAYNGNFIYYDDTTTSGGFKIGNPTTYYNGKHWDFTWEHGRQLATMFDGTATWTNTYNSDGLRTSRTNGTITYNYYYEGSQLTSVTGSNGNIWIFYDGNRPVIIKYGDTATYHYELNLQGDVIAILDSDGTRVVEYTYDAWGNILSISGSMKDTLGQANPLRYRGYVYDNETGLYYLQSRYYDPQTHRFLNADEFPATGQGVLGNNMFAYCGNNPIIRADSEGTWWHLAIGAIVGVVSQYVSDVVYNLASGDSILKALVPSSSPVDYLAAATSGALSASGVGTFGSAIANATIDGLAYVANCGIDGKKVDGTELLFTVTISALTSEKGIDGGNLRGVYKHSTNVLKTAVSTKKIGMYVAKKNEVVTTVIEKTSSTLFEGVKNGVYRGIKQRLGL